MLTFISPKDGGPASAPVKIHRRRKASSVHADRRVDVAAMVELARPTTGLADSVEQNRRLIADFCRFVGKQLGMDERRAELPNDLTPRMRQTLQCLLNGDSEKEIAAHLSRSKHTVHVYVKQLYRKFQVSSRGELLARFVDRKSD